MSSVSTAVKLIGTTGHFAQIKTPAASVRHIAEMKPTFIKHSENVIIRLQLLLQLRLKAYLRSDEYDHTLQTQLCVI